MLKKLITMTLVLMLAFTICAPIIASAYGDTMSVWAAGSRSDLIYIKRPESLSASTSDKTYTISAVGSEGTSVSVYKYNSSSDEYNLIKGSTQIGASGLYSVVVDLNNDSNTFRVYASNYSGDQIAEIYINKIKKSTVDRLKGITVTIRNFF